MTEYLFEIVWTALMLVCIAIIGIFAWLDNRKIWEIIVDGERFELVTHLDINRRSYEIKFFDLMTASWRYLTYSRLEAIELRYGEKEE